MDFPGDWTNASRKKKKKGSLTIRQSCTYKTYTAIIKEMKLSCKIVRINYFSTVWPDVLPLGIPHGGFVRTLSKKSKSYFLAGGNDSPTWPLTGRTEVNIKRPHVVRNSSCCALMIDISAQLFLLDSNCSRVLILIMGFFILILLFIPLHHWREESNITPETKGKIRTCLRTCVLCFYAMKLIHKFRIG